MIRTRKNECASRIGWFVHVVTASTAARNSYLFRAASSWRWLCRKPLVTRAQMKAEGSLFRDEERKKWVERIGVCANDISIVFEDCAFALLWFYLDSSDAHCFFLFISVRYSAGCAMPCACKASIRSWCVTFPVKICEFNCLRAEISNDITRTHTYVALALTAHTRCRAH